LDRPTAARSIFRCAKIIVRRMPHAHPHFSMRGIHHQFEEFGKSLMKFIPRDGKLTYFGCKRSHGLSRLTW